MINLQGVSKATWVRIISLFLVLVNQIAISFFDFNLGFEDAAIYEGVSTVLTFVVSAYAAWKNNSMTVNAQLADEVLKGARK